MAWLEETGHLAVFELGCLGCVVGAAFIGLVAVAVAMTVWILT